MPKNPDRYPATPYEEAWMDVNRRLVPKLPVQEQHDLVELEQRVMRKTGMNVDMARELLAKLSLFDFAKPLDKIGYR